MQHQRFAYPLVQSEFTLSVGNKVLEEMSSWRGLHPMLAKDWDAFVIKTGHTHYVCVETRTCTLLLCWKQELRIAFVSKIGHTHCTSHLCLTILLEPLRSDSLSRMCRWTWGSHQDRWAEHHRGLSQTAGEAVDSSQPCEPGTPGVRHPHTNQRFWALLTRKRQS